jgi:hypothetical protein
LALAFCIPHIQFPVGQLRFRRGVYLIQKSPHRRPLVPKKFVLLDTQPSIHRLSPLNVLANCDSRLCARYKHHPLRRIAGIDCSLLPPPARRRRLIPVLLAQPLPLLRLSIPALLRRLSAAASVASSQSKPKQAIPVSFIRLYPATILCSSVCPVPSRTRASALSPSSSSLVPTYSLGRPLMAS